jgi:threonine dehydratase
VSGLRGAVRPIDVFAAARRLEGVVRRTPLERSAALSEAAGCEVFLKLETQQATGSFKARGAANALALLDTSGRAHGVVTASAGNHGLGVALAAQRLGICAHVLVPADAPAVKRRRIARLGAAVHEVAGGYDEAHVAALDFASEHGARYVHAFSEPAVVAGQGTVGLEIVEQLPAVQTVLVPVGGGGLIGGIGVLLRALTPGVRLVGVQSEAAAAMHDSLAAGRLVPWSSAPSLCDGLAGDTDQAALDLVRDVVDEMVLVSEAEVRTAIRRLYEEEAIVAEGSAAVVAAALWEGRVASLEGPVAAVLTGGNLDAPVLAEVLGGVGAIARS